MNRGMMQFMREAQKAADARFAQVQKMQRQAQRQAQRQMKQARKQLGKVGEAGRSRIAQQGVQAQAGAEQSLISRGLGGTTVRESVMRGIQSDTERARQGLEEGLAQQMAGLLQGQAGMQLDIGQFGLQGQQFMPGLMEYLQMMQMFGGQF
jgi:hypothetical protein